jgi:hypothetical protein
MKLTDEQLVEFYKGSTDRLMERMKEYALYAAADDDDDEHDAECDNDYDGGRFDYLTSRGVK